MKSTIYTLIQDDIEFVNREKLPEQPFQTIWEQVGGSLTPSQQYRWGTLERILERRLADLLYYQSLDLADFIPSVLSDIEEENIRLVTDHEK